VPIKSISNAPIPPDEYDKVAANLAGPISAAEGFLFHIAESTPDGIRVTEVWASREQAQQFYDTAVRPNLPPGVPEPTITELHTTIAPAAVEISSR
jgi:quinol monooxygenase YgiN